MIFYSFIFRIFTKLDDELCLVICEQDVQHAWRVTTADLLSISANLTISAPRNFLACSHNLTWWKSSVMLHYLIYLRHCLNILGLAHEWMRRFEQDYQF